MIDGSYTEDEWREVLSLDPEDVWLELSRGELEEAAKRFLGLQGMKEAAKSRDNWKEAKKKAEAFKDAVVALGAWDPSTWDYSGERDPYGDRAGLIEQIDKFLQHAEFCRDEYDRYARGASRQQNPAREDLYRDLLSVWADQMGRPLTWSPNGPLEKFFQSAVRPILGARTPKSSSIRDIVKREVQRRDARSAQPSHGNVRP